MQDLVGNDGRVILMEKTNQNLLQCRRIIGMCEEMSMLVGVLEIRVKCKCHLPNVRDLTGLESCLVSKSKSVKYTSEGIIFLGYHTPAGL